MATRAGWTLALVGIAAGAATADGPHGKTRVVAACPTARVTIGHPVQGSWVYHGYGDEGASRFRWHGYGGDRYRSHGRSRSGVMIHLGSPYGFGVHDRHVWTVPGYGHAFGFGYEWPGYVYGHHTGRHIRLRGDGSYGSYTGGIVERMRVPEARIRVAPADRRSLRDVSYGSLEQGWDLLARGEASRALRVFAVLSEASPDRVLPMIGLALASGLAEDDRQAVWAMRRAFARDADGISSFPQGVPPAEVVRRLEARYLRRIERDYADVDAHFMLGALAYLRQDMERALVGVAHAEDHRDRSRSVRELRRVVERHHPDFARRGR